MCGRFVQALDPADYAAHFGAGSAVSERLVPSYNVAPTDSVYAVAEHDGDRLLGTFRWGLVPFWAEDPRIGARHINARAESVASKPAFRQSFRSRRCIIPADGFYEWERRPSGGKLPHFVHDPEAPLALAGLWSAWRDRQTGDRLTTCTIITTDPNDVVRPIHDRMPVVLAPDCWDRWLDREVDDLAELQAMLRPAPAGTLSEFAVSTLVNSVENDYPACIEPLEGPLPD